MLHAEKMRKNLENGKWKPYCKDLISVSLISNESPSKDGNARFTTVPGKVLSDQVIEPRPVTNSAITLFKSNQIF